jgi:hypothetical protein
MHPAFAVSQSGVEFAVKVRLQVGVRIDPPDMANISPSKYSLLNSAARSNGRYCSSVSM